MRYSYCHRISLTSDDTIGQTEFSVMWQPELTDTGHAFQEFQSSYVFCMLLTGPAIIRMEKQT